MTTYTIQDLANSKGVSQPVREALMHMEAELTATDRQVEILSDALAESRRINAELLETLKDVLPMFAEWHEDFPEHVGDKEAPALAAARAAITRATGEQA